jgi:hypothetical protein
MTMFGFSPPAAIVQAFGSSSTKSIFVNFIGSLQPRTGVINQASSSTFDDVALRLGAVAKERGPNSLSRICRRCCGL